MQVGDVIDSKYKLVRVLGESGVGLVYEARREGTDDHLAIKLIHSHATADAASIEACLSAARAVGALDSPHLPRMVDTGTYDKSPYLVRPYLDGFDLQSLLADRAAPLLPAKVIPLIRQACDGLTAALEAGQHHWDLKPQNLFVTTDEPGGQEVVKILDFGVSRLRDALASGSGEATVSGTMLGLPYYMPMEQIRGVESRDQRVDIYALGAILYELLAGVRPYEAEGYTRLLLLVATTDPKPIKERRPELGDRLAEVIHRALRREPSERFETFAELSAALAPLTDDIGEAPQAIVATQNRGRERSNTLPEIPMTEQVKRAAKMYEERERVGTRKAPPEHQVKQRSKRRFLVAAVAASVAISALIVTLVVLLGGQRHESSTDAPPRVGDLSDSGWVERCSYYVVSKQYDTAETACTRGLEASGDAAERASLLYNLGRIAAARGDVDTARQRYESALQLDPDNPAVLRRLEELPAPPGGS